MNGRKIKVNWTIDPEVVEAVKEYAQQLSVQTEVKISESAAVNRVLKKALVKDKKNGR